MRSEAAWLTKLKSDWSSFPEALERLDAILQQGNRVRAVLEELKAEKKLEKLKAEQAALKALGSLEDTISAKVDAFKEHNKAPFVHQTDKEMQQEFATLVTEYRRRVEQTRQETDQISADVTEAEAFQNEVGRFQTLVDDLRSLVDAARESTSPPPAAVPWQVAYSVDSDPTAQSANGDMTVNFYGGKILDRFGRDIWEDRCCVLGLTIQSGSFGEGTKRYRSLQTKGAVRSELAHQWQTVMANAEVEPRSCRDTFVLEDNHPVMAHIKIVAFAVEKPEQLMARALHAAFVSFPHRPLLGSTKTQVENFLTYAEVHAKALRVAHYLHNLAGARTSNFTGIWLPNGPEWIIADFACALNATTSVGMHQSWPSLDILEVIAQTQMNVCIAPKEAIKAFHDEFIPAHRAAHPKDAERLAAAGNVQFVELDTIRDLLDDDVACHNIPTTLSELQCGTGLSFDTPINIDAAEQRQQATSTTAREDTVPLFTLMYSSGTSGSLKAIEVTQDAWFTTNARNPSYDMRPYSVVSYVALAHGLDRGMCWGSLFNAGRISCYDNVVDDECNKELEVSLCKLHNTNHKAADDPNPSPTTAATATPLPPVIEILHRVQPSIFVATPDLWATLYAALEERGLTAPLACRCSELVAAGTIKVGPNSADSLFDPTTVVADGDAMSPELTTFCVQLKSLLFGKNICQVATGGAPITPQVITFFKVLLHATMHPEEDAEEENTSEELKESLRKRDVDGVWHFTDPAEHRLPFSNVYGATEAPGISTDTVIRSGLELKLLDVPAMGYKAADGIGEIVVRGSGVAKQYFNNMAATDQVFKDGGWYHTGDVGRLVPKQNGAEGAGSAEQQVDSLAASMCLHIVDRANDMLELYYEHRSVWVPSTTAEELLLGLHRMGVFVHQAVMCCDRMQPFLVAVVTVDLDKCSPALFKVEEGDVTTIVERTVLESARHRAAEQGLPDYFAPRGILVKTFTATQREESIPWTKENGFCSALNKVKRRVVRDAFAEGLASLFARIASQEK